MTFRNMKLLTAILLSFGVASGANAVVIYDWVGNCVGRLISSRSGKQPSPKILAFFDTVQLIVFNLIALGFIGLAWRRRGQWKSE